MRQTGCLQVIPHPGQREGVRPAEPPPAAPPGTQLVEPSVGVAGADGQRRILREHQNEVERVEIQGRKQLAPTGRPGRTRAQKEGHVRSHRERDLPECLRVLHRKCARQAAQHRGGIGGAAPEPGRHGDSLVDPDGDAVRGPKPLAKGGGGASGEVRGPGQFGKARHPAADRSGPARHPDLHPVAKVERDHERAELVVTVWPQRADLQHEVHFGGGEGQQAHRLGLPRVSPGKAPPATPDEFPRPRSWSAPRFPGSGLLAPSR